MPHIHEHYDYIVTVFIVYNGRVLLVNHPRYGRWLPVGGHIELNEDPEMALHREIAEETGLQVKLLTTKPLLRSKGTKFLPTPNYVDVHEANPPHQHISFTYFARASSDRVNLSKEHTDSKWFRPTELEDTHYGLTPAIVFFAREALKIHKHFPVA